MPSTIPPDLAFLVRQQRDLLAELGGLRRDTAVLKTVLTRLDGTLATVLLAVREMNASPPHPKAQT